MENASFDGECDLTQRMANAEQNETVAVSVDPENDFNGVSEESEESNLMTINLKVLVKIRASPKIRECPWECKAKHDVAIITF